MRDFRQQSIRAREFETSDYWNTKSKYWSGCGKPKYMQCDFETFSQVNLANCGSYRYIEDSSFEPLILAVAFDDEEVFVIDLAEGEDVPDAVWIALFDDEIIKTAWNAQFERTVFGRMIGETLSPDSWRCTMVWAASLSLPMSLKNTAAVLETSEQKDRAGENLIRFFSLPCKATNSNGGRTRNLPVHAPEEWSRFKEYCRQDVRTERDIRRRLEPFPMMA